MSLSINSQASDHEPRWSTVCGKLPKEEVIYFSQVLLIFTVVLACLINLSLGRSGLDSLWSSLLSGSVGYLLPSPNIRKKKNDALLSDATE